MNSSVTTPVQLVAASIAWMLVHSIWQGALIGILAVAGRRIASSSSYRARIGTVALLVFIAAQAVTLVVVFNNAEPTFAISQAEVERTLADVRDDGFMRRIAIPQVLASEWIERGVWLTPYVATAWVAVLVTLLVRALISLWIVQRLLRESRPVEEPRRGRFAELSRALDIRRPIAFAETDHSTVPVVTGMRVPTVLIPPAEVLPLSEPQLEALVLHELAHVRRRDVAAGVGRAFVGCLYFFHPAVAVIRRLVDHDAEEAADELAAKALGDRPAYAGALLTLVQCRQASPLLLGAAGGSLRHRIVNVLRGPREARRRNGSTLFGTTAAALVGLFLIGQMMEAAANDRADMAWIEAHDLAAAVVSTLTTDADNPKFDDALRQCVIDLRSLGEVRESSRVALSEAALVGAPSDRMYRFLCETGFAGGHPDFGGLGTIAEQQTLVEAMRASAKDLPRARATVVVAAACSLGDNTVQLRNILRDPELSRLMRLDPTQFYRLQLARSALSDRLRRFTNGLDLVRRGVATPADTEVVWQALRNLPDMELSLSRSPSVKEWPTLLQFDDRMNAGRSFDLLRRATSNLTSDLAADHQVRR